MVSDQIVEQQPSRSQIHSIYENLVLAVLAKPRIQWSIFCVRMPKRTRAGWKAVDDRGAAGLAARGGNRLAYISQLLVAAVNDGWLLGKSRKDCRPFRLIQKKIKVFSRVDRLRRLMVLANGLDSRFLQHFLPDIFSSIDMCTSMAYSVVK